MPTKCRTTKKRTRRGGSLRTWAKKSHAYMRSKNGYSKGLHMAYHKYGKKAVASRLSPMNAALVDKGVSMALSKMYQSGYGRRRTGMGLRLAGGSKRMKY
jgi:hypothetical protein